MVARKLIKIQLLAKSIKAHMRKAILGILDLVKFQQVTRSAEQTHVVTSSVPFRKFMKFLDSKKMKLIDSFG